ncbi:Nucleosome assembly protein 1-like 4 [Orchesella cincta]|uniref:Nucleosome assembly protein 1-like 4 n=1 Tax=Orchesella cincta TaxID=48709 RepID=A0A1D2ND12_ORCCI|nr:Nucleosome assembly protein 1-like 4 [Orchesella cincta]
MSDPEKATPAADTSAEVDEVGEEEEEGTKPNVLSLPPGLGLDAEIQDIPAEVERRIKALKKIQVEITQIESQFFSEMHELEVKYAPMYTQFFEKRREIVLGKYEPTDAECDFSLSGDDSDTGDVNELVNKLKLESEQKSGKKEEGGEKKEAATVSGVPEFWLTIFRNVGMLSDMVQEHDIPIIKHLNDIKVEMTTEPMGFQLFFDFSPNEYFTNSVLTKKYEMKCEVDPQDPFSFEGPEIIKCSGCKIDWNKGKNVTIRVVRKKQKHKQRGSIRMVSKTEEVPSFFDFFNPPEVLDDIDVDEETQIKLTSDFEVGQYIRERIVPRAVLYYTGEALEDDYDEEEEEEEEEEGDDGEEDDDDDVPHGHGQAAGGGKGRYNRKRDNSSAKQNECKQQ